MTFEEWWKASGFINGEAYCYVEQAWNAATQAERKRCVKIARDITAYTRAYDIGLQIADTIENGKEGKGQ